MDLEAQTRQKKESRKERLSAEGICQLFKKEIALVTRRPGNGEVAGTGDAKSLGQVRPGLSFLALGREGRETKEGQGPGNGVDSQRHWEDSCKTEGQYSTENSEVVSSQSWNSLCPPGSGDSPQWSCESERWRPEGGWHLQGQVFEEVTGLAILEFSA